MKAWYILKAYDLDELCVLLDVMGIRYLNPVSLRAEIHAGRLTVHEHNLLQGYLFARLDIASDYYRLIHNEMFPNNKISILQTGGEFIHADQEADAWIKITGAVSLPLRLRQKNGQYIIAGKTLPGAKVIHYYRRKLNVAIELPVCGHTYRLRVAAYDFGNHGENARTMSRIWKNERKQTRLESRRQRKLQMARIKEILQVMREKRPQWHLNIVKAYRFASFGVWFPAPDCAPILKPAAQVRQIPNSS